VEPYQFVLDHRFLHPLPLRQPQAKSNASQSNENVAEIPSASHTAPKRAAVNGLRARNTKSRWLVTPEEFAVCSKGTRPCDADHGDIAVRARDDDASRRAPTGEGVA